MSRVIVYTSIMCGFCTRAKQLLEEKGVAYDEVDISRDAASRQHMMERSGRRTVPQIFVGDTPIGGYQELRALEDRGELDAVLGRI